MIGSKKICYQPILHAARRRSDAELAHKLITFLKSAQNLEFGLADAYSILTYIYCDKGQLDQARASFNELDKAVGFDKISKTKMRKLTDRMNKLSP